MSQRKGNRAPVSSAVPGPSGDADAASVSNPVLDSVQAIGDSVFERIAGLMNQMEGRIIRMSTEIKASAATQAENLNVVKGHVMDVKDSLSHVVGRVDVLEASRPEVSVGNAGAFRDSDDVGSPASLRSRCKEPCLQMLYLGRVCFTAAYVHVCNQSWSLANSIAGDRPGFRHRGSPWRLPGSAYLLVRLVVRY